MKLSCKCGREGYLRVKWIWGSSHFEKRPYLYMQHREGRPKWCYLGRLQYWRYDLSDDLRDMLPNSLKDLLPNYSQEIQAGLKRLLIPVLVRLFPHKTIVL